MISDMRIKDRHKHVDLHGMVYLPYLHDWKPGVSSLYELVSYMSSVFSDDPPVYKYDPLHPPKPYHLFSLAQLKHHCSCSSLLFVVVFVSELKTSPLLSHNLQFSFIHPINYNLNQLPGFVSHLISIL